MTTRELRAGAPCPVCTLEGTLSLERTSEADLIDGRTVVVHGVPTYVCDRCGIELYDLATTRALSEVREQAARDRARTYIIDFGDLRPAETAI